VVVTLFWATVWAEPQPQPEQQQQLTEDEAREYFEQRGFTLALLEFRGPNGEVVMITAAPTNESA
jgi:Holliday junction resolvase-like predicted endonuclease